VGPPLTTFSNYPGYSEGSPGEAAEALGLDREVAGASPGFGTGSLLADVPGILDDAVDV